MIYAPRMSQKGNREAGGSERNRIGWRQGRPELHGYGGKQIYDAALHTTELEDAETKEDCKSLRHKGDSPFLP
jgi:hypothetical protein